MASQVVDRESMKARAAAAIAAARDELIAASNQIHAHPELNYEERRAAALLTALLERHGFAVERGVCGIETAFRATVGTSQGPTVAFLAEYDALPEIGHGCGHNLIAISNVGAGIAAAAARGDLRGRLVVLGTPAEEGGGGKIRMIDGGAFADVDVALSSHPSSNRTAIPTEFRAGDYLSLAMVGYQYAFHGKAAHAAVVPHLGVNALNAVIRLFTGIDALRQHLRDDVRIHGVITDGGRVPNVVPEFAAASFMLRSKDSAYLEEVVDRVKRVAEGAALEMGARVEITLNYPLYKSVLPNAVLARLDRENAERAGLRVDPERAAGGPLASTDLGNVSLVIPTHAIRFAVSDQPVAGHSRAMTEAAATPYAHENALEVASALAMTALDLLAEPSLVQSARDDFEARRPRAASGGV